MKFRCLVCGYKSSVANCPQHGSIRLELSDIKISKPRVPFIVNIRVKYHKFRNKVDRYMVRNFFEPDIMNICPSCQRANVKSGSTFNGVMLCNTCTVKISTRQENRAGFKHRGKIHKIKLHRINRVHDLQNRRKVEDVKWLG